MVLRRRVLRARAPLQDSLGFWIPFHGSWIPGAGFQSFSVERGFWIPFPIGISEYSSSILDSKALDSGFYKQKFSRLRNPDTLTWGEDLELASQIFSDLFTHIQYLTSGKFTFLLTFDFM